MWHGRVPDERLRKSILASTTNNIDCTRPDERDLHRL